MNQEIMEEWLKDLRDGTRTQGFSKLKDINGNQCCLDVLCEQAVRKGIISPPVYDTDCEAYRYYGINGWGEWQLLPVEVINWAGLDNADPEVLDFDDDSNCEKMKPLSRLNDILEENFFHIADCIEKTFKEKK